MQFSFDRVGERGDIMRSAFRRFAVAVALLSWCLAVGSPAWAQPEPVVAIHVSELTRALETMPAKPPTPSGIAGTTGYEWWVDAWHYFVIQESIEEALRSDGTPFVEVSDADIASGVLLRQDGSPKYPILISLAAEAVADNEIAPLRNYVAAGGFLFVGSSALTRNQDGTTRGNFALASEMGLRMVNASLQNWYENRNLTKLLDHRIVSHIPSGTVAWRMPRDAEEVPLGVSPKHAVHPGRHFTFRVSSTGATVLASGDSGPLVATQHYGLGQFIYHGAMQPLVGHGVYDPAMYAYLIYRRAIEWAFETAGVPLVRLSPWRFDLDAALIVRHDFENSAPSIRQLEQSAIFEQSLGVKGDYYFTTGTLREEMPDRDTVVQSLRRAVGNYGATIGPHNGGLRNPVNLSLSISDFDYWHWGPDEALTVTPPGYPSGKAYALDSVTRAFQDVEGWLTGLDNGRPGCAAIGNCPRVWAAPYFNSTREDSYDIIDSLGTLAAGKGEQKIGPFPHWTLSYRTPGKRYFLSMPASDWYVGSEIPGALEWGHTTQSMQAAVDFYYDLGAPINLYGHIPSSDSSLVGQYIEYAISKPRMWRANTVEIADWWQVRSSITVTPAYTLSGNTATATAFVSGSSDPDASVDFAVPTADLVEVDIGGAPADPADYRLVGNVLRVRTGTASSVQVLYSVDNPPPAITGISPASAVAGGTSFVLTVDGTGFAANSTVQWNGSDRPTTFVSINRLAADISSSDIAAAGTASVGVVNPAPGGGTSNLQTFTINAEPLASWTQTDWSGGAGQALWSNPARYDTATGIDDGTTGQLALVATATGLFSDDFTRSPGEPDPLAPWTAVMGTWSVAGGVMQGSGSARQYSYARPTTTVQWTDYTVQARIQMPTGSFGGGVGGRADATTGAHYGAWVYPTGSAGGSNVLKLWKFRGWTDLGPGVPMQQVTLPPVGTNPHTLQLTFVGSRIRVYYDGMLMIDVTDNNFDSRPPYLSGTISADWWTGYPAQTITIDDVSITALPAYGPSGTLTSSAFDGGSAAPWQDVVWQSVAPGGSSICVRTRAADSFDQLGTTAWSACYTSSGSGFLSENRRWAQYQVELSTTDPSSTPVFNEITLPFVESTRPTPLTTTIAPASATAGDAGFTLTVTGSDFATDSVVQWNAAARTTAYISGTQLTAVIPATDIATAGTADVTVFTPAPGGGTSNAQTFTIEANNPVPNTTSLAPASVGAGSAEFILTVNGAGFVSASIVQWNGASRPTTFVSASQLTATISASDVAVAGSATVAVSSPAPGGGTSNALSFTIIDANPVPTASALSPTSADAGGAAFILGVSGTGFVASSVVHWNGTTRPTTFVSGTQLSAAIATADIATAGTASVTVVSPAPGGGTSNALTFTVNNVNPVPAATSLNPATAAVGGAGFTMTVTGTGFVAASIVQWNGASRPTTYVSSTQLTADIASTDLAAAGNVVITVFTPAPGGGTSSALTFTILPPSSLLFADDFTRAVGNPNPLAPWTAAMGTWSVSGGVMQGTGSRNQYAYSILSSAPQWTDYVVQGRVQLPSRAFGGGIGGRLDPVTGAHYGAWIYPAGSSGGSNVLKLWKFRGWSDIGSGVAMGQVSVPAVGTAPHTLQLIFEGSRIRVYYDGVLMIDVTDQNFDGRAPYLMGGISADWFTGSPARAIVVDDVSVRTP